MLDTESAANGPNADTSVGDIVSVAVGGEGSYGVTFLPDSSGFGAVIGCWVRASGGKIGVIQKHGGVHLGDVLVAVNDTHLDSVPYNEVLYIINDRNILKKDFKFMSTNECRRRK